MIWNPEYETMPWPKLEELQLARLKTSIKWVQERVPFYREKFREAGVSYRDIKSLNDLTKFPFTTKDDLRDNYPYGMFALLLDQVVRIQSSSGTTGKPIVVGYSRGDINTWAELTARIATAGGVGSADVCQISFGYGLFTGGFGFHYGVERIGATVIPVSAGNTERQIMIMKDFGTTALICTPSYALYISEVGKEMGIDWETMPLKLGLFGAEPWSEELRKEIEERLKISATDNYGLTEVMGPGVSGECEFKHGLHVNEDHFIVEIINPETGENVEPGKVGELVFTSLTKEAFPIVRYRTRDLSYLMDEPCSCGRTFRRMAKVRGRTDDMIVVRGVNVFPSQVEAVLAEVEGVEPHFQIVVDRKKALDTLEVWVEISEDIFPDAMRKLVEFEKVIEEKLLNVLSIRAEVKLVEPKTIERTVGKAQHVVDKRVL